MNNYRWFLAAVLLIGCLGCDSRERAQYHYSAPKASMFEDKADAAHLAVGHPRLQEVCEAAGGCDAVLVSCTKWDDGGTVWTVEVPGAGYGEPLYGRGLSTHSMDDAAIEFFKSVRQHKAEIAYQSRHPKPPQRSSHSCDPADGCVDTPGNHSRDTVTTAPPK